MMFEDWKFLIPLTLTIIGILIAAFRYLIASETLKILIRGVSNQDFYEIYLNKSIRVRSTKVEGERILMLDLSVKNTSPRKSTINFYLDIKYFDKNQNSSVVRLQHDPSLKDAIPQKNIELFDENTRLEEKDIKSGWCLFKQPVSVNFLLKEKYTALAKDVDGYEESIEPIFIMQDLHYETTNDKK